MKALIFTVGKRVFTDSLEAQDYATEFNSKVELDFIAGRNNNKRVAVIVSGGQFKNPEKNTKQPNQTYTKSEKELIVKTIKDYFSGLVVPEIFREITKLVTYEELCRSVISYERVIKNGSNDVDINPDDKMLLDAFIDEQADKQIEIIFPNNPHTLKICANFATYFCNQIIRNSF